MGRSRSSFEITGAIAAAAALAPEAGFGAPGVGGAPLVSFSPPAAAETPQSAPPSSGTGLVALQSELPPSSTADMGGGRDLRSALPPSVTGESIEVPPYPAPPISTGRGPASAGEAAAAPAAAAAEVAAPAPIDAGAAAAERMPRPPDLKGVVSPVLRCERVLEWIALATGATDVFLADAAGLPLAGSIRAAEARLAASGWGASALGALGAALPGAPSPLFEVRVGEGPSFQLIGFQVSAGAYVVGLSRAAPLSPRQTQAIRAACRHALGGAA
ncbi:MAG: hypothetical protein IT372_21260 [Polyangiaceae bacterium]|nr:hypothetical protein [Polyangiaceae bacterium]